MYEVVRDPGWPVTVADVCPKQIVIDRSIRECILKETGSDVISAPGAIMTLLLPSNFNFLIVLLSIELAPVEAAIITDFIMT
jgi:hypothetical protein